jgi:hypothetical protein
MLKSALSLTLLAAIWATAGGIASAQGASTGAGKPSPPATTAPATTAPTPPPAAQPTGDESEVVARVDSKPITWGELVAKVREQQPFAFTQAITQAVGKETEEALFGPTPKPTVSFTRQQVMAALRANPTDAFRHILQDMIYQAAIAEIAPKEGVVITEGQVESEFAQMLSDARKQGAIPAGMTDDQFLKNNHITKEQLKPGIRVKLELFALVRKEKEKALGHPFGPGDFYQASHILIRVNPAPGPMPGAAPKPESTAKADADAKAKIISIANDIKAKKITFEDAAKKYSDDGSKMKGGDLGPAVRGQMVKPFEDAALSLKPGQISAPVRSDFGYHLIRLDKTGYELSEPAKEQVLAQMERTEARVVLERLVRSDCKVENKLPPSAVPNFMGAPGRGR